MIRSQTHSSYPVGDTAPGDEAASVVVAEQSRAFVDVVTDGLVRWSGPVSHLCAHIEGLRRGAMGCWLRGAPEEPRPEVVGPLRRRGPFLVHDFTVAAAVGPKLLKMVLPGPVTFSRIALDEHYGSREALARDLASILAEEAAALAAAGCRIFHLDEPLLCRHPEDAPLVSETAQRIFAAADSSATTILSTSFGDLTALGGAAGTLPGTHLGLDLVHGPANEAVVRALPPEKGVALGVFDAARAEVEDAADVARRLEPLRDVLVTRDVLVGPQAGLVGLSRDQAFDKLLHSRYLVEKLSRDWRWTR